MTTEELQNKIGMQMGFLLHSNKPVADTIKDLKSIAIDYAKQFQAKAEKWDKLDAKIAKCYFDEDGEELSEEDSENIDLGTIGQIAASEFGYL